MMKQEKIPLVFEKFRITLTHDLDDGFNRKRLEPPLFLERCVWPETAAGKPTELVFRSMLKDVDQELARMMSVEKGGTTGQMKLADLSQEFETPKVWVYEKDNGTVMAKCPKCEKRMTIDYYMHRNPYHFCPFCGEKLGEGKIGQKRLEVYGYE